MTDDTANEPQPLGEPQYDESAEKHAPPAAPVAGSDENKRRRAELAKELGYFPATLDPEDIERHRRLNAALDAAPTRERIGLRYRHLSELRRQREVEERGRKEVADLYE